MKIIIRLNHHYQTMVASPRGIGML